MIDLCALAFCCPPVPPLTPASGDRIEIGTQEVPPLAVPAPRPWPDLLGGDERPWHLVPYSIVDAGRVLHGGARVGNAVRTLSGLTLGLDLRRGLGLEGATLYGDLQWIAGDDGAADVGDLQGTSNIDHPEDRFQLGEVWFEQRFDAQHLRLKLGKVDANTEFAMVESGVDFLNASAGISPSVHPLPTYPDAAFGANLFVEDLRGFSLGLGLYDGAWQAGYRTGSRGPSTVFGEPSDLFSIAELDYAWEEARVGIGAWHHSGDFERWAGGVRKGAEGYFALAEGRLTREVPSDRDDDQGLRAWTLLGLDDEEVSPVDVHAGGGLLWTGLVPGRDADLLGLGVHCAWLSDEPGAGFSAAREVAYEAFYAFELLPGLRLQPDLQYVVDPGGAGLGDAFVATLRLALVL